MNTDKYLEQLRQKLLVQTNFQPISMSREWANKAPSKAGVYVFKDNEQIVYVGETGNLKGRFNDILDSRHHTIRRTIGIRYFSTVAGFEKATTNNKFPKHIETLVNEYICTKLKIAYLEVSLGRKELEEIIESKIDKAVKLNNRGKRKTL